MDYIHHRCFLRQKMRAPNSSDKISNNEQPEKAFDALINDLIAQRKLQQEALAKIKASVEGVKPAGPSPVGHPHRSASK
jgi:hypothetical protein